MSRTFWHYLDIDKSWWKKYIAIKEKSESQVRNSMETKLGQSFQLLEVRNKSELLQKYIHTMQTNLIFIVTLVQGYIPVVIGSKAIMRKWKKKMRYYRKSQSMFADISWMEKKRYHPKLSSHCFLIRLSWHTFWNVCENFNNTGLYSFIIYLHSLYFCAFFLLGQIKVSGSWSYM